MGSTVSPRLHTASILILLLYMSPSVANADRDLKGWISPKITDNGDFAAPIDKKGRVPFWSVEGTNLIPGRAEGRHALGTAPGENGTGDSLLVLSATGDWYAVSSVNYPIVPWTDRFEITARVKVQSPGARGQILVVWCDDYAQHVARIDQSSPSSCTDWSHCTTGPLTPPAGAKTMRPLLVAGKNTAKGPGRVCFDDIDIRSLPPLKPKVAVWVNQVGYERDGPKSAVIATNFPPDGTGVGRLEVISDEGSRVYESVFNCSGRMEGQDGADWGWWFWRADFSDLVAEGSFHLRVVAGGEEGNSFPLRIGKRLLLGETASSMVDFFFVQRCGFEVPGWHSACHLDDAKLPDGTHRNLTGGWHSAGDYNKITWEYGDGGVVYSLMHLAGHDTDLLSRSDRDGDGLPDIYDEAWWGAKYLAKLQDPVTGGLLNTISQGPARAWMRWTAPEYHTDNVVGTTDDPVVQPGRGNSPLAIGGWALLSTALGRRGITNDYRDRALRLWEDAARAGSETGNPLMLLSAIDLDFALREAPSADPSQIPPEAPVSTGALRDFTRRSAEALLNQVTSTGQLRGGYDNSGDIPAGALATFALHYPEDPLSPRIKETLARHLGPSVSKAANPFGISRQKEGVQGYYFDPSSALGMNYLYACRAWSSLVLYRLLGDRRALVFATDHLDFILGKNPYNLCMLEGKGSLNPPRYHHRYNKIPGRERGAVPGAIPNGFVRDIGGFDRPGFDLSTEGREYPSYRTSEPWLVHNVFFTLAIASGE